MLTNWKTWGVMVLIHLAGVSLFAQDPPDTEEEFQKNYEWRIRQEFLFDVYIPKDLGDAFSQLNRLIDQEDKAKFRSLPEEEAFHKLFFSLGRWITHNWGFYEGSRLSHSIRQFGITHPEDMARFIIVSYHRYLNTKEIDVKGQIAFYREKYQKEREERLKKAKVTPLNQKQ